MRQGHTTDEALRPAAGKNADDAWIARLKHELDQGAPTRLPVAPAPTFPPELLEDPAEVRS
jgi:hypothetical protein